MVIVVQGRNSVEQPGEPVPTVSEWGIVAATLLMFTAGTLVYCYRMSSMKAA